MFDFTKTRLLQQQRFRLRAWVGGIFVLVCFALLVSRLWFLQVDEFSGFVERADRNRIAVEPIVPRRGLIEDRDGAILAQNRLTYVLEVVPADISNMKAMLAQLTGVVSLSPYQERRFQRSVRDSGRYARIILRDDLSDDEAARFAAHAFQFPGVTLRARWVRDYPQDEVAAHVVGYVGRISPDDQKRLDDNDESGNYRGTEDIGKKGIERTYESQLHGKTGLEEVEVTAGGRPVRQLQNIDPVPGDNVVLSLDLGLERVAMNAMAGHRGALVAIDPNNGEVLAMVSMPSYDPNQFVGGIDEQNWRALLDDPDHPLINRAVSSVFPIGSTYKPFVGLAALQLGKRSESYKFNDIGYYEFAGQRYRDAAGEVNGWIDMRQALIVSSDAYFFSLGPVIGVDALHDFTKQFGFGQISGIDLDGERAGVLPSTEWKRHAFKNPAQQRWYAGESLSIAIGQGYDAFTMLQLSNAIATLADNGLYHTPHLLHALQNPITGQMTPAQEPPARQIPLNQEYVDYIKSAMVAVTQVGTAKEVFKGAPYVAATKTGTAQVYSLRGAKYNASRVQQHLRDHSVFVGYAPADHPQIAVAVIIENGGWGASVAGPVVRKVFDYWLLQRPGAHMQPADGTGAPGTMAAPVRAADVPGGADINQAQAASVPEPAAGQMQASAAPSAGAGQALAYAGAAVPGDGAAGSPARISAGGRHRPGPRHKLPAATPAPVRPFDDQADHAGGNAL